MTKTDALQVHIPTDGEYENLAHVTVETDEMEYTAPAPERDLVLSRGGDIEVDEDEPYTFQSGPDIFRTVIPDKNVALAYYLHALETHSVGERAAMENLTDLGLWIDEYIEWTETFSPKDRRLQLMDLADWRTEHGDFAAEKYFDESPGTWRSANLTESGQKLAEDIFRNVEIKPRMCYWTAQQAAILHENNHRVSYVEGLVLPKQLSQCVRHAWIEIDGEVAELTWPWHFFDGCKATYFGHEFDKTLVRETRERRDVNGAIALSDSEVQYVGDSMGGRS